MLKLLFVLWAWVMEYVDPEPEEPLWYECIDCDGSGCNGCDYGRVWL